MKKLLVTFFLLSALINSSKSLAVAIADGEYMLTINLSVDYMGFGFADVGSINNRNTFFIHYGQSSSDPHPVNICSSFCSGMFDQILSDVGGHSTVAGNGNAGEIGLVVSEGNVSVTSFQVDSISNVSLSGTFAQDVHDLSLLSGVTNNSETILDFSARTASYIFGTDLSGVFGSLTTGTSTVSGHSTSITLNGTPLVNIGDINSDGLDDYTATFVSTSTYGSEMNGLESTPFGEVWNTQILSVSPVPIPAAVWLFGSGLIGLVGLARQKKS